MTLRPIVVRSAEGASLSDAAEATGLSERTLRRWNTKFRIARRTDGSRLLFSLPAVLMLMHDDDEALDLLRDGKRAEPRVVQYFEAAGVMATP